MLGNDEYTGVATLNAVQLAMLVDEELPVSGIFNESIISSIT
jgi:hypothetical protein